VNCAAELNRFLMCDNNFLVSVLKCSLRSSEAKATLMEESLVLGRKIDKLHPPDQAASSSAVPDCGMC
jgi:hypothetical protein